MQWSPNVLAQALIDAGFTGEDVVTGVAAALALTGGDDAYYEPVWIGVSARHAGAWAAEYPKLTGQLHVNTGNLWEQAGHVFALWNGYDHDWWRTLNVRYSRLSPYMDLARDGALHPSRTQGAPHPVDTSGVAKAGVLWPTLNELRAITNKIHGAITAPFH